MVTQYDPLVYTTYERFLLYQYNVETAGLYYTPKEYLIHCPRVTSDTKSIDGGSIHKWLDGHRMIGQWVRIVDQIPEGAIRIDQLLKEARPLGTGYLITQADIENEIDLLIPGIFPDYELAMFTPQVIVNFKEEITSEGEQELKRIFSASNFPYPISFTSVPMNKAGVDNRENHFFKNTTTFRKAKKILSGNLLSAYEKDEDEWVSNRNKILNSGELLNFKPASFSDKTQRALIDTSLNIPDDIRNYLTLFEQVAIVCPRAEETELVLKGLGISKSELLGLIELGKVQLLFPNSIEVYDTRLISEALERRSGHVHLIRSINSFTIEEMRKRNPFFFPNIPTNEKQVLLGAIDASISSLKEPHLSVARKVIAETGHGWLSVPNAINDTNITFISQFGLINILDAILKAKTGKDLKLELMIAAPPVELAAATGSVLMPTGLAEKNLSPFSQVIANFYSGVPNDPMVVPKPEYANFAVEEILAISEHVPILDFVQTFNSAEISRFRTLVFGIANTSTSPEDLEETIVSFNHFVRQFEKDKNRLSSWNLKGFLINQIGKATGLTYGSWALKFLSNAVLKHGPKNEKIGAIIDSMEAQIFGAYPSTVLVSNLKSKIKKKL